MGLFGFGNKRQHYRASFSFPGELEAVVIPGEADAKEDPAEVLDTSFGGCALAVSADVGGRYPVGSRAHIRFTRSREGDTQLMAVEVVRQGEAAGNVLLGLKFLQPESFATRLTPTWWRYFNRRSSFRVACGGEQAVAARLVGAGTSLELGLANLSVDGFGAVLGRDMVGKIAPGAELRAALTLKSSTKPLRFVARIFHVTPRDRRVILGAAFDPQKTPEFPAQQETISRWVGAWQQAQIARKDD